MSLINLKSCRICLKNGNFTSVFQEFNGVQIKVIIFNVTSIKIIDECKLPASICDFCLETICLAENLRKLAIKSDNYLKALFAMEYGNVYSESTTETELVHKPIFQNLYANTSTSTASNIKNEPTENSGIAPSIFDNDSDSFGAPDHFDDDFQSNDDNNLSYLPLKTDAKQTSRTPISRQVAPTVPKIQEPRIPKVKRKKGEKTKSEPKNLYPCTFCGLEFKMVQHCIRHEMVHTGLKPFQCDACPKKFTDKAYLRSHIIVVHLRKKNFKCEHCGFEMYSKTHYNEHRKSHTAEKDAVCKVCSKSFVRKDSLKVHMRVHTGERPFQCKYCPNTYIHHTDVKRHEMIHTGERKYNCEYCNRGFIKRSGLTSHMNTHKSM